MVTEVYVEVRARFPGHALTLSAGMRWFRNHHRRKLAKMLLELNNRPTTCALLGSFDDS
jgi:hypothetical protein